MTPSGDSERAARIEEDKDQMSLPVNFSLYQIGRLSHRYLLGSLLGFFGGPLAFYAGERLGAVEFLAPRLLHFAVLAIVWALAFPLLLRLSDTLVLARGLGGRYRFASGESNMRS